MVSFLLNSSFSMAVGVLKIFFTDYSYFYKYLQNNKKRNGLMTINSVSNSLKRLLINLIPVKIPQKNTDFGNSPFHKT